MDLATLRNFLLWCTILNFSVLLLTFVIWLAARNLIYRIHSTWFGIPRTTFDTIFYAFLGFYKVLIFVFNLVPLVALLIIGA